jgi:ADP-heptose:LPS heptosyltransferase
MDNMGDLLMTSPALAALKESFGCKLTLLTSTAAKPISEFIPGIDEVIVWDALWVRSNHPTTGNFFELISVLKAKQFDGAIIFTVFSQNPLPAAMLLTLTEIPQRLAYCRENPYNLLTDWIPDPEPYHFVQHQVKRDLDLVKRIGVTVADDRIKINITPGKFRVVKEKLDSIGVNTQHPWVILHPGVSEEKRKYPVKCWIDIAKRINEQLSYQVLITGSSSERDLGNEIMVASGGGVFSCAGKFDLAEFISLIANTTLVISVNTATIHIAAATQTKIIVLYALTNPQHSPWKAVGHVLPFEVSADLHSRNMVLRYVQQTCFTEIPDFPFPEQIVKLASDLLCNQKAPLIPELITTTVALREKKSFEFP